MIGLLVGSLLLTPVSASVSDNLNSALVSVLSKLGESSASIAANTGSLSSLGSIDNKLNSINQSIKDLSVSTGSSSTPVAFKDASWYTIHQALQRSDLEKQNWGVGDVHKSSIGKGFVILKLVYNSEGTPDELVLGCLDSVGSYSLEEGITKCESFYQEMITYTGVDCGVSSRMPSLGEISSGADVHLTSTNGAVTSYNTIGNGCQQHWYNGYNATLTCYVHWYRANTKYLSNGSTVEVYRYNYHGYSRDYSTDVESYQFINEGIYGKYDICPIVIIN